jgi:ABC-type polysaccharide/polyol phosphate transport system ATPase subunit
MYLQEAPQQQQQKCPPAEVGVAQKEGTSIALFGCGDTGRSTIYKLLQQIQDPPAGWSLEELNCYTPYIRMEVYC